MSDSCRINCATATAPCIGIAALSHQAVVIRIARRNLNKNVTQRLKEGLSLNLFAKTTAKCSENAKTNIWCKLCSASPSRSSGLVASGVLSSGSWARVLHRNQARHAPALRVARAAQQPLKELRVVFSLKKSRLPAATPRVSKQLFRVALKATF